LTREKKIIFTIDIDNRIDKLGWLTHFEKAIKRNLEAFGFKLEKIIWRESPSKRGLHGWLHCIGPQIDDEIKNMIEALCYNDLGRSWINHIRITQRNNPYWEKVFSEVTWQRPIDEKCQNCKLRKYLEELK